MVYVRREYPEWSWSFSRKQVFEACLRRYFYQYYASHNGWERGASSFSVIAYRLKNLSNLYTTLGEAVHKAAEMFFSPRPIGAKSLTEEDVETHIRQHLRYVFRRSRDDMEGFKQKPNRNPMLFEFYYGNGPDEELVDKINARVVSCAKNLVVSKTAKEFGTNECVIRQCEQFDSFLIDDTKVFAIPDLIYQNKEERWVIVDWKTGDMNADNIAQVGLYCMYVTKRHSLSPKDIKVRLEYLDKGTSSEYEFDGCDLEQFEAMAKDSIAQMKGYLTDPKENVPKPIVHFPLTKEKYQCKYCNFLELCQEELKKEGEGTNGRQTESVS